MLHEGRDGGSEGGRRGRGGEALPVLVILACWLVQWGRVALTDHTFYQRDYFFLFEPLLLAVGRLMSHGVFPAWNPWLGSGTPLAADPNAGVFFPDSLLLAVLGDGPQAVKWLVLVRLLALPLLAYAALRAAGLARAPACGGALIASLSGPVTSSLSSFPTHLGGAVVFLPLAVAGWRLARGGRAAVVAGALLLALAIVAGSPEMAAQGALAFVLCGVRRPLPASLRRLATAGAMALLMAAPLLLPAARLFSRTPRAAGIPSNTPAGFLSVHPSRLLELVWPGLAGDPMAGEPAVWWGGDLNDPGVPIWFSIAAGLVATLLVPVAARSALGRRLLVTAILLVLIGLGRHLPLWDALGSVPLLGHWRYPEKWILGVPLLLAGLAAVGIEELRRDRAARALQGASLAAGAAACGLAGSAWLDPDRLVAGLRALRIVAASTPEALEAAIAAHAARIGLQGALVALGVVAILLATRHERRRAARPALLVGLVVAERLAVTLGTPPTVPEAAFGRPSAHVERALGAAAGGRFFYDAEATNELDLLRPFTGTKFGLAYAGNTDLDYFSDARYRAFAEGLMELRFDDPRKASLLALADVRAVSTGDPTAARDPRLAAIGAASDSRVLYRLDGGRGARLYHRVWAVGDAREALRYTFAHGLPIDEVTVAEGIEPMGGAAHPGDGATIEWPRPDRFRATVTTGQPALLFVPIGWDPGWRIEVDGGAARAVPAASTFLGIVVGAGRHTVTGRYREPAFAWGGLLSLATLVGAALWVAGERTGARAPAAPSSASTGAQRRPRRRASAWRLLRCMPRERAARAQLPSWRSTASRMRPRW